MPRVILMDDQADVRAVIGLALRLKGFEVVDFETGAAGLAAFETSPFDLAIVDIFLGRTNGADVIRALRERSLQKPFRPKDLLGAIEAAKAMAGAPATQSQASLANTG
jgi:CheY-like chemotaxis protein